jgi:hypothetical protein
VRLRAPSKAKKRPDTHRRASPCHGRPSPEGRRSAPTTDTMSPVPPATSPLPPATPTTVTATHVAMRADHHRLRRLRRLGSSRRDTPADHCKTGDGNYRARQDICEEVAATHCSHCVFSLVGIPFQSMCILAQILNGFGSATAPYLNRSRFRHLGR